jgi:hypothetical protein
LQVSKLVFSSFKCNALGSAGQFLAFDYRVNCDDRAYLPYAFVMLAVWPVGYPVLALSLMVYYGIPKMAKAKQQRAALAAFFGLALVMQMQPTAISLGAAVPLGSVHCQPIADNGVQSGTPAALHDSGMIAAFAKAVADGVTSFEQLRIAELRYLAELNSVQVVGVPTAATLAKLLTALLKEKLASGAIVLPVLGWDPTSQDAAERAACTDIGALFAAYEPKFWW